MKLFDHKQNFAVLALILLAFAMWFYVTDDKIIGYDQARFYLGAVSLNQGTGYNLIWLPEPVPERIYPPLYSGFLAFLMFFTESIFLLKFTNFVFHTASAVILMQLAQRFFLDRKLALLTFAAFILNPISLYFASYILNEFLFMFFTLAAFYVYFEKDAKTAGPIYVGIFVALAMLVRVPAFLLALSVFISYLYFKKYRHALYFILTFALIASLNFTGFVNSDYITGQSYVFYGDPETNPVLLEFSIVNIAQKLYSGFEYYFLFPLRAVGYPFLVVYGILLLPLYNYFISYLKNSHLVVILTILSYFVILLLFPWRAIRYLLPLVPFLVFLVPLLYSFIIERLTILKDKRFYGTVLIAVFVLSFSGLYMLNQSKVALAEQWSEYTAAAESMQGETGNVMSRRNTEFYLFSGLKSVVYPLTHDAVEIENFIEKNDIRYFVYDQFTWVGTTDFFYGEVKSQGRIGNVCFTEFRKTGQTIIYQIDSCTD